MRVSRKLIGLFLLRLFVAYLFISVVMFFTGPWITKTFLPAIRMVIHTYGTEQELLSLETVTSGGYMSIMYEFRITKHFPGVALPLIETLTSTITASILFVPHIIFYSLILSWPIINWRRRLAAIVLSVPVMTAFFIVDAAVTIMSSIELETRSKLVGYVVVHAFRSDILVYLSHFFNNGGRQFMGVLIFIIAAVPLNLRGLLPNKGKDQYKPGRNDPCPCGSGKKYKHCCGS